MREHEEQWEDELGLHISSMNGLQGDGYQFYILTYGLDPGSPEFRIIQERFSYFADLLGVKGLVVTGSYDGPYRDNFAGFLEDVENRLFSAAMIARDSIPDKILPVPALVALRKADDSAVDLAYFCIRGRDDKEIVSLFRDVSSSLSKGRPLGGMPENLLSDNNKIADAVWGSIQIRPSFFGVGVDVKDLLSRLAQKRQ